MLLQNLILDNMSLCNICNIIVVDSICNQPDECMGKWTIIWNVSMELKFCTFVFKTTISKIDQKMKKL